MDEYRTRNLNAVNVPPIANLQNRTRADDDISSMAIASLETKTAYSPDATDTEVSFMPDVPPVRKAHQAKLLADVHEPVLDEAEKPTPLNAVSRAEELPQENSITPSLNTARTSHSRSSGSSETIKKISPSDMANILLSENDFAISNDQLHIYSANEGYWLLLPESEANRKLRSIIPEELADIVNKNVLSEIYEWLRTRAKVVDSKTREHRYLLNFADCAIDWRTQEPIQNRKAEFFRYALQMRYYDLPSQSTGAYKKFLNDIFGKDKATMKEFRKFLGLCLSDIRKLKLCFFLYGPSNTGKSVVLNLLKRIVGAEWCSSISFTQMSSDFALTQLLGKRLNLSGEVSGASNKKLDIFKTLTGNDSTTACYKGKDYFQFNNEALLVFACNDFPPIQAVTEFDSFISRVIIFPFENVKPRNEWIENLENVLLEDANAIIADAIKGLNALEKCGFQIEETPAMHWRNADFRLRKRQQ